MKISTSTAHHSVIFTRLIACTLSVVFAGAAILAASDDLAELRTQLDEAHEAQDKPSIVEISRRIIAIAPVDESAWESLVATQLELEDLDRAEQSLNEWEKATRPPPAAIEDFRGDLCVRRKDYSGAEQHWLAFLARKPKPTDAANMYDKLADLCLALERWSDRAVYTSKAIAARDSAPRRVAHATALLRLRQWDPAIAEITKANRIDSTNALVKEWLPRFERLQGFLPKIKAIDRQLATSLNNTGSLLDRARLLTFAELPRTALDDCQKALALQPDSMRARIQAAEAFFDDKRPDEAAKLQVSLNLVRAQDGHVSEQTLRALEHEDVRASLKQTKAEALAQRSRILRTLNQFVLALADSKAALVVNDSLAAAHIEAAFSLKELDQTKEALEHAIRATELNPDDATAWFCRGVMEAVRADLKAAVDSQTRALKIRESLPALRERERCARQSGQLDIANADLNRINQLEPVKP